MCKPYIYAKFSFGQIYSVFTPFQSSNWSKIFPANQRLNITLSRHDSVCWYITKLANATGLARVLRMSTLCVTGLAYHIRTSFTALIGTFVGYSLGSGLGLKVLLLFSPDPPPPPPFITTSIGTHSVGLEGLGEMGHMNIGRGGRVPCYLVCGYIGAS